MAVNIPGFLGLCADSLFAEKWSRYTQYSHILTADKPQQNGSWLKVSAKKRYIDPLVCGKNRVSSLSPLFASALKNFLSTEFECWLGAE
ncbi:MAG: hypothetical protein IJ412_05195 [Oscillospiraceae bacterium]|nr:hypothetical protein [Oscillospiraceae bacterium]